MGSWSYAGYYRQSFQVCPTGYSVRGSQKQSVFPGENFLLYHQEEMLTFCSVPVNHMGSTLSSANVVRRTDGTVSHSVPTASSL